jgi:hypothetical protein
MLSAMRSLSMVKRMIMITGTGDHDRPEWLIIITGIRRMDMYICTFRPLCTEPNYAQMSAPY